MTDIVSCINKIPKIISKSALKFYRRSVMQMVHYHNSPQFLRILTPVSSEQNTLLVYFAHNAFCRIYDGKVHSILLKCTYLITLTSYECSYNSRLRSCCNCYFLCAWRAWEEAALVLMCKFSLKWPYRIPVICNLPRPCFTFTRF